MKKFIGIVFGVIAVLGLGVFGITSAATNLQNNIASASVPATISSISIINTTANLALAPALQKVVVELSSGQDTITTETRLQKQVTAITNEQTALAAELTAKQALLTAVTMAVTPKQ